MSVAAQRQALADAVSTVNGLTGFPYFVQTTTPGDVLVRLERIDYPNVFGGVVKWGLVLVLPQDLGEAERFTEDHAPALRAAVEDHLVVTAVEMQRLQIEGVGLLPIALFTGHREED